MHKGNIDNDNTLRYFTAVFSGVWEPYSSVWNLVVLLSVLLLQRQLDNFCFPQSLCNRNGSPVYLCFSQEPLAWWQAKLYSDSNVYIEPMQVLMV